MKYKLVFYHIYIIQSLCFVSLALKLAIERKICCVFFFLFFFFFFGGGGGSMLRLTSSLRYIV